MDVTWLMSRLVSVWNVSSAILNCAILCYFERNFENYKSFMGSDDY